MLGLEKIAAIKDQASMGKSVSEIARALGVDRKTVRKYVEKEDFNHTVEDEVRKQRGSKLDPYKDEIRGLLHEQSQGNLFNKQRWTAKRMHEYLWKDKGHEDLKDSYQLVQRYMQKLRKECPQGYIARGTLPLEWHPGEAQADFGEADFVTPDGSLRRLKYFVLVFPYSNRLLCTVMPGENCECVCQSLSYIFDFLGGVPWRIVFDNATGIGKRVGKAMRESEEFTRFRLHHGFLAEYTNPYSGWEKGSVENGVKCVRQHLFVPPMMIADDLDQFNREVMLPLSFSFRADEVHYRKGLLISELFKEDQAALREPNRGAFMLGRIDHRELNGKGGFSMDGDHWYFVGPQAAGSQVMVRRTCWAVEVYDPEGNPVKRFQRVYGDGHSERYDLEAMLRGLSAKAGAWRNSVVRDEMEDGPLKSHLDSLRDKDELRDSLRCLSSAADRFGFADAIYAANSLIGKGHFPSSADIEVLCRRLQSFPSLCPDNPTGVSLSIFDGLLPCAGEEAVTCRT